MAKHTPEDTYRSLPTDTIDRPPDYDDVVDSDDFQSDVHLASIEEKKRRWWRNAIINMLFIASWCVSDYCRYYAPEMGNLLSLTPRILP